MDNGYIDVDGETYWHIWRTPNETIPEVGKNRWVVGESYEFGKTPNPNARFYDTGHYGYNHNGKFYHMNDALLEMGHYLQTGRKREEFMDFYHYDTKQAIIDANQLIYRLLFVTRENLFEEIRLEQFPSLPSRLTSFFVFNSDEKSLRYWAYNLLVREACMKRINNFPAAIVGLKLTGKVFKTNRITGVFLPLISAPPAYWREQAVKYWSGSVDDSPDAEEVLFEGTARVEFIIPLRWQTAIDPPYGWNVELALGSCVGE